MSTPEEQTNEEITALSDAIQALAPSASRAEPTPGPWAVDPDGDVEDAQRANVALVMHSGRTEGARLANARLIAAAPLMADYLTILEARGDNEARKILRSAGIERHAGEREPNTGR